MPEKMAVLSVGYNMKIQNGNIFTKEGCFQKGDLFIKDGIIKDVKVTSFEDETSEYDSILDAENLYVLPGFVDIHLHGCNGVDFCEATKETFEAMENYQMHHGITTIFPATMTLPEDELEHICQTAAEYIKNSKQNVMAGITMEGPFLSKEKKGAQEEKFIIKAENEYFQKLQKKSNGLICQVAVAPEEEGAMEFIQKTSKNTVVSLAHSTAGYEVACKAIEAGATHVTHLFNGMNPFLHREPGIVGAAFDKPDVFVELICDGVHIHPSVVRSVFKMFGAHRICMISDSLSATGMENGEYFLGGQKIFKKDNKIMLQDGTLAGSACNLYDCFKKTVLDMKVPLEEAVLSCTKTPAKSLNADDKYGIIK